MEVIALIGLLLAVWIIQYKTHNATFATVYVIAMIVVGGLFIAFIHFVGNIGIIIIVIVFLGIALAM